MSRAEDIFRNSGGFLRMSEAIGKGISRHTLYSMKERGEIEQVSRGLYRLAKLPPMTNPDLAAACRRIPGGVICLVSALFFHGITTEIPRDVSMAIRKDTWVPEMDFPPVRAFKFSMSAHAAGIEEHRIDGVTVKVYSPEKTLADCFKFRNKIGMDVVLEALKLYRSRMKFSAADLVKYGRICRVEKVMRPYLEAVVAICDHPSR